jgi:polyribonucleotide 5'-hydroxyl-kinase
MGWVDGQGYKLLLHALDALKVDNVLVIGQERLHSNLVRDMRGKRAAGGGGGGRDVQVWKLPKSGGVVGLVASCCIQLRPIA